MKRKNGTTVMSAEPRKQSGNQPYDPGPNRKLVRHLAMQGMSKITIADQAGISESTLYAHHKEDLRLGLGDEESLHRGNINSIAQQKQNPNAALKASTWVLEHKHGYDAQLNINVRAKTPQEIQEEQDSVLEELDRKLEPYLKLDRTVDFDRWSAQIDKAMTECLFKGDMRNFKKKLTGVKSKPVTIDATAEDKSEE
ncbi:MAG: hypothetical protein JJ868_19220 [Shimia sp.]|uniref:hypothetical protein n=1 Tax=Shimia sp. TaxID=1954381 RepID=UPI001B062433|nr:hypothetical protein [Shimia sp.]MBO6899500.1 hypothetical protein [Shimia sp.]